MDGEKSSVGFSKQTEAKARRDLTGISLGRRMMFMSILVSLAALFISTWIVYSFFDTAYSEKVNDYLSVFVERNARDIDTYLTERQANIRMITATSRMEEMLEPSHLEERLKGLQKVYPGVFDDMGLIDPDGNQVSYAGPYKLGQVNYADAEWFREAIRQKSYSSNVFLGIRRIPHFIVTSKVMYREQPWLLRATINFGDFNNLVKGIRIGETGAAFVINREGQFQTQRRSDIAVDPGIINLLAQTSFNGTKPEVREHTAQNGKTYLLVSAPLNSNDWILVLQQLKSDALVNLYNARYAGLAITIFGALCIVLTVTYLSTRMLRKLCTAEKTQEVMQKQMVETGKLAAIGELAAGIAHEINNPVAIMIESAGWIQDLIKLGDHKKTEGMQEIADSLNEISLQGRRCKEITHKLLSFARRTDPRINEVDVVALLQEMIALTSQKARFNNISIEKEFEPGLPAIMGSSTELQQVILNLINNAIDAIAKDEGRIIVRCKRQDENIVIDVEDTGQGIAPANLARIFEPFYTTKPVGKGTGLGLAICFGVVNKMGGEITVESEVNVGTVFHVSIPISGKD
jgi:two-component system NtrC family sensor kinase